KFNNSLFLKERKKRYNSKVYLCYSEVEHFCRDYLKNKLTKRVRILRVGILYPTRELDKTLSNLDLYDEVR
ncbi:hypothetical protein COCVIDRAFT_117334, partial [Bipolaris victoriae FI3]